jgi:hypothetical protein
VSSDDPFPKLREVIEAATYRDQIGRIGGHQYFDIVVETLIWGIATNAEAFDPLPGFPELRMAMGSHPFERHPIKILFRIVDDERLELLWIELESTEDAE